MLDDISNIHVKSRAEPQHMDEKDLESGTVKKRNFKISIVLR
jgi:hypothetical protein